MEEIQEGERHTVPSDSFLRASGDKACPRCDSGAWNLLTQPKEATGSICYPCSTLYSAKILACQTGLHDSELEREDL